MMGVNGRQKGSSFERHVAKIFEEWSGSEVRRTPLSGGWAKTAKFGVKGDLISTDKKFPFSVECKKQQNWVLEHVLYNKKSKIFDWWDQCTRETPEGKLSLLVFSKNHFPTFAMCRVKDYKQLNGKKLRKVKYFVLKTKKTGLCYVMLLDDFLAKVPYPSSKMKKAA